MVASVSSPSATPSSATAVGLWRRAPASRRDVDDPPAIGRQRHRHHVSVLGGELAEPARRRGEGEDLLVRVQDELAGALGRNAQRRAQPADEDDALVEAGAPGGRRVGRARASTLHHLRLHLERAQVRRLQHLARPGDVGAFEERAHLGHRLAEPLLAHERAGDVEARRQEGRVGRLGRAVLRARLLPLPLAIENLRRGVQLGGLAGRARETDRRRPAPAARLRRPAAAARPARIERQNERQRQPERRSWIEPDAPKIEPVSDGRQAVNACRRQRGNVVAIEEHHRLVVGQEPRDAGQDRRARRRACRAARLVDQRLERARAVAAVVEGPPAP